MQKRFFGSDLVELYENIKKRSKKFGGYYMFYEPIFVPTDLELIKKILVSDFNHFTDRISHVDDRNDPLSANILFLKGNKWREVRQLLRPSFSSKTIKMGIPKLNDQYFDVKKVLDKYNIDLIGSVLLDVECNALICEYSEIEKHIHAVLQTSILSTVARLLTLLPLIKKYIKIPLFNKKVSTFFIDFVKKHTNMSNGVIQNLIPLSVNERAANAAMMFLAGYDTTSNTTSFCLYELALHPRLQDNIRSEISSVLEKHGGVLNQETLTDLELLEKCLRETLRKYPVSTAITRTCVETYHVPDSDIIIEKGSKVYIPVRAVHWDADLYPNPELFNPERFTEMEIRKRHPTAWIPFSDGFRHCIGHKLAKISMKFLLAQLLNNYSFTLHPDTKHLLEYDPKSYLLQAKDNIKLRAVKLN
ncbi:hypothetical protein FQR65_LT01515 [Abscondita terminalis]|nr:hypothetical protein FQR65_LT01515 [Abscondita terminalis]